MELVLKEIMPVLGDLTREVAELKRMLGCLMAASSQNQRDQSEPKGGIEAVAVTEPNPTIMHHVGMPDVLVEREHDGDRILDYWRLLDILGTGGQGVARRAEGLPGTACHGLIGAAKTFGEERGPEYVQKEGQMLEKMTSVFAPATLATYPLDQHVGPSIVLELAKEDLSKAISCGFTTSFAIKTVLDICKGCAHMHSVEIIHRDLKPENLLLFNEACKICDFGCWVVLKQGGLQQGYCGTRLWMAPEVKEGHPYSFPIDIYSLGMVMSDVIACVIPLDQQQLRFWRMAQQNNEAWKIEELAEERASALVESDCGMFAEIASLAYRCLSWFESDRPTARELFERMVAVVDEGTVEQLDPRPNHARGALASISQGASAGVLAQSGDDDQVQKQDAEMQGAPVQDTSMQHDAVGYFPIATNSADADKQHAPMQDSLVQHSADNYALVPGATVSEPGSESSACTGAESTGLTQVVGDMALCTEATLPSSQTLSAQLPEQLFAQPQQPDTSPVYQSTLAGVLAWHVEEERVDPQVAFGLREVADSIASVGRRLPQLPQVRGWRSVGCFSWAVEQGSTWIAVAWRHGAMSAHTALNTVNLPSRFTTVLESRCASFVLHQKDLEQWLHFAKARVSDFVTSEQLQKERILREQAAMAAEDQVPAQERQARDCSETLSSLHASMDIGVNPDPDQQLRVEGSHEVACRADNLSTPARTHQVMKAIEGSLDEDGCGKGPGPDSATRSMQAEACSSGRKRPHMSSHTPPPKDASTSALADALRTVLHHRVFADCAKLTRTNVYQMFNRKAKRGDVLDDALRLFVDLEPELGGQHLDDQLFRSLQSKGSPLRKQPRGMPSTSS